MEPQLFSAAPTPPAPPSSQNRASLPVWPSPPLSWPPPCSLRAGGGNGRRGYPLESVVARICREAGGRVTKTLILRNRMQQTLGDWRWLLTGCLSLEAPSWLWTPPLSAHSMPMVNHDGCTLMVWPWLPRQRKERRYPELVGRRGRARLVVLAVEVCGRWSQETQRFLSSLARAKARSVPPLLRKRGASLAPQMGFTLFQHGRWGSGSSLLELPGARCAEGLCPASHEVERDFRHAGLDPQLEVVVCVPNVTWPQSLSQKKSQFQHLHANTDCHSIWFTTF